MSEPGVSRPGDPVHVSFTKWGGKPHWQYDCVLLGADRYGVWLGGTRGTPMFKPGVGIVAASSFVIGLSRRRGHAMTFWTEGAPHDAAIYVDITTVPVLSGLGTPQAEVTMVDLDLDVIRLFDDRLLIDDEDEFAEHQVTLGYPVEVVRDAKRECQAVYRAMEQHREPYATVGARWLEQIDDGSDPIAISGW